IPWDDAGEIGHSKVDVRRVELVCLDRECPVLRKCRPAIRDEPLGLIRSTFLDVRLVEDEAELGWDTSHRPGGAGRCGRRLGGRVRHPSDPSISSFTSRLNSIAYSIGSSFVNTSRKPWTIRFCASFSVRPRLIR